MVITNIHPTIDCKNEVDDARPRVAADPEVKFLKVYTGIVVVTSLIAPEFIGT